MKRRLLTVFAALSLLLCVATVAMWVRSYCVGDYIRLGPYFYLSFARGYCRVVHARWVFVPPYPTVGSPIFSYPLDKVGEYHLGSGASYMPMWLLATIALVAGIWLLRKARRWVPSGLCPTCGYDLRATPDRCPECGEIPVK